MNNTPAIVSPAAPLDRAALLASLTVNGKTATPKGQAFREGERAPFGERPYTVVPYVGLPTRHESATLAITRLANL